MIRISMDNNSFMRWSFALVLCTTTLATMSLLLGGNTVQALNGVPTNRLPSIVTGNSVSGSNKGVVSASDIAQIEGGYYSPNSEARLYDL